jgi:hypothetical protein
MDTNDLSEKKWFLSLYEAFHVQYASEKIEFFEK